MDHLEHCEETAGPILKILMSQFSFENSPGPHVVTLDFSYCPRGAHPGPIEEGKFEGSFQSQ